MNKPYRPRLPEVIAMMEHMPGTDRELQPGTGHSLLWTQQKLAYLVSRGVIRRRHDVYSVVRECAPSYTLQILDAIRTAGSLTRKDLRALGINERSACSILCQLERRGQIVADPVARPLRYSLIQGLEQLADYEASR